MPLTPRDKEPERPPATPRDKKESEKLPATPRDKKDTEKPPATPRDKKEPEKLSATPKKGTPIHSASVIEPKREEIEKNKTSTEKTEIRSEPLSTPRKDIPVHSISLYEPKKERDAKKAHHDQDKKHEKDLHKSSSHGKDHKQSTKHLSEEKTPEKIQVTVMVEPTPIQGFVLVLS